MMHSRSINNKIKINNKIFLFWEYYWKDKAVKIHVKNLQVLLTEMFKVKNGIAPKIISDIFKLTNPIYNLRNKRDFVSNHETTVYFGTESISYLGPKLWDFLPQDVKTLTILTQFKSQVKKIGSTKLPLPIL